MIRRSVARSARAGRWGYWLALGWSMALTWACDVQTEDVSRVTLVSTSIPTKSISPEMFVSSVDRGIQTNVVRTNALHLLSHPVVHDSMSIPRHLP
jgi:hypothetical protein